MPDGRVNNGGPREGAGRPRVRMSHVHEPDKLQPIEYALMLMRDQDRPTSERVEAMKIAIPYCSARLQATDLSIDADLNIQLVSYLDDDTTAEPDAA